MSCPRSTPRIGLAAAQPGDRLVDLATGTGLLLRRLAAAPVRPRAAIGVDRSAGMLAHVGELPAGWSTLNADARAVPLPDGSADVVTCAYLLHLLDPADRAAVLAEARRLLAHRRARSPRLVVVTTWAEGDQLRAPRAGARPPGPRAAGDGGRHAPARPHRRPRPSRLRDDAARGPVTRPLPLARARRATACRRRSASWYFE